MSNTRRVEGIMGLDSLRACKPNDLKRQDQLRKKQRALGGAWSDTGEMWERSMSEASLLQSIRTKWPTCGIYVIHMPSLFLYHHLHRLAI